MNVLITDFDFPNVDLELDLFKQAGLKVTTAQCKTADELIAAGQDADAFLLQYAPANRKVFEALPGLKIVSRYGAVRAGKWHYLTPGVLKRPSNMTVGVLGMGRIGRRFAHLARETYGKVIACDPHIMAYDFPPYVERVDMTELFATADIISVHTPLNDETRNIVNSKVLNLMTPGSYVVNTARGGLVNVEDALAALNSGQLGGLALDVLPNEPPGDHPLVKHPRTILTPHAAFYSQEAEIELRRKAAQNIITFARTGKPDYLVTQGVR